MEKERKEQHSEADGIIKDGLMKKNGEECKSEEELMKMCIITNMMNQ